MSLNFYRPIRNGRTAKFLTGIFALSFMLSMTVQPLVFSTLAGNPNPPPLPNYYISQTGSPIINNLEVSLVGVGGANNYNGNFADVTTSHGVSIDWGEVPKLQHGLPVMDCSVALPGTVTFSNISESPDTFSIDWSGSHTYNTSGTYHVFVRLHHQQCEGAESSQSTIDFEIVIPPPTTQHTITASAGSNGSISPSGAVSVTDGTNQSFTITPDAGYHVADVLVDASSVTAVTSYTFTNNTADHTIAASFAIDQLIISNEQTGTPTETTITVTWTTNHDATSRVVYGTSSVETINTEDVNYGYTNSTVETDNDPMVTSHTVVITGLTAGTEYFFRPVSHGSPEVTGIQVTGTTASSNNGGGSGGGGGSSGGGGGSFVPLSPTPTPSTSSGPTATPTPAVLGATTTLPETSLTLSDSIFLSLFMAMVATGGMMLMIGFGLVPKTLEEYLD